MTETDDSWLQPFKPSYQTFYLMVFAAVIIIAGILVLMGAPVNDPLTFLMILAFIFGFGLICSLLNREVSRSLGFKGAEWDTPL
ncbi:MAG: hypothetical protein ACFFE6_14175 [Candidatus Thorarchaeota archaeon]